MKYIYHYNIPSLHMWYTGSLAIGFLSQTEPTVGSYADERAKRIYSPWTVSKDHHSTDRLPAINTQHEIRKYRSALM